ncbi:MAG: 23S rRNA (adenine(2503)-C(2))-methyltransferase RlmN [Saprospirales bacterium]|nr:MAG: 23S rRNA (adenine(2503)-C(2))-methyltransferase RlmN [Saprospirales bacterium]
MKANDKKDIRQFTREELTSALKELGEPSYRADQIWKWLWNEGAGDFDQMTNLSKKLREKLSEKYFIPKAKAFKVQNSNDGTLKSVFELYDGAIIEAVLIPVPKDKRFTLCVSCQVGCSLSCSFCATGKMKRVRNLTAGEIVDQFFEVNKQSLETFGHALTNIVYMGMGEPLLNYKEVMRSIHFISHPDGINMSPRRITVSTAGIAKMIRKLADDEVRFNLALSLHAANDEKRNEIMAINEQNDLSCLMEALRYFYKKTGNRISYEYIAFQNFNDHPEDARELIKLCKHFPVRVNIIEYNPVEGLDFIKSDEDRLDKFAAILANNDVRVTVRRSRGKDIDAACGQLANKSV